MTNEFRFFLSPEFAVYVRVKVDTLDGALLQRSAAQLLEEPDITAQSLLTRPSNEMFVSAQLYGNGGPIGLPVRTPYHSTPAGSCQWNEWLTLPARYSDLPLDSCLAFTVYDIIAPQRTEIIGGTTLPLFTKSRKLRKGRRKLHVWRGIAADGSAVSQTPSKISDLDEQHRLERLVRQFSRGRIPKMPILDALTYKAIDRIVKTQREQSDSMNLYIELPDLSVLFRERELPTTNPAQETSNPLVTVVDPEMEHDHPAEIMQRKLSRKRRRGAADKLLKPDVTERKELAEIQNYPSTQVLQEREKDLLWTFRYTIARDKKGLAKFLRTVDWNDAYESKQASDLMDIWVEIDVDDALELLSKNFPHPLVRLHAVKRLLKVDDEAVLQFLLQLVQALRYEAPGSMQLGEFLIDRAVNNPMLCSYFYWYLSVAAEDVVYSDLYINLREQFMFRLQEMENPMYNDLNEQARLMTRLNEFATKLATEKDRKRRIELAPLLLSGKGAFADLLHFPTPFRHPLDPSVIVTGIDPKVHVFKSAKAPLLLNFKTVDKETFPVLYKCGDDLRQDQLVIQLISLMDRRLKQVQLDLKLCPYKVLATSNSTGLVQVVLDSKGVADVLADFNDSILKYFASFASDQAGPLGVRATVMENYIRSCAGYCVITYLLGIGDRHLDNLMLSKQGNLFHIDFGYILGHDPKPYPPPMKIVKQMIEAMGNDESPYCYQFKQFACEAFNILRRSTNLIINLFVLMLDANIPDLAADPDKALLNLQQNFRLDLNDDLAVAYMQGLMTESVSAFFPKLIEKLHQAAQAMRS
eukprot:TRINITY_DN1900_c0_g2_i3.p1 TRINITY_DN1900_c0_g2~~TRINITY_DN1900_c0_g2_i3.p1  ORF type:complete len:808 (-),score=125.23 TRINITY_DN1900_c0_g2_i3:70-2493(-)